MRSSQGISSGPERGDRDAIQSLIRNYLPLAYNIVGWALNGHPDTDRAVQAAMIEAFRDDDQPVDTTASRSRIVAACIRQVREVRQAYGPRGSRPQDPDFVKLMVERLGLTGEEREITRASRWLDDEDRLLLALWWQEAAGTVTRAELARALRQPAAASARFIAHVAGSLQESRVVDRALRRAPVCRGLAANADEWDRKPSVAWRDRLAAHARDCPVCLPGRADLSPADWLLNRLSLVPPPSSLTRATLRSILGDDDLQAVGAGSAQRPAAADRRRPPINDDRGRALMPEDRDRFPMPADRRRPPINDDRERSPMTSDHRRPPAKSRRRTLGGVRWSRSTLLAVASGVVLCVLVAAFAVGRPSRPSSTASPTIGASTTSAPRASGKPVTNASGKSAPVASGGHKAPSSVSAPAPVGTKGVGTVAGTGVDAALAASGASWYYNWASTPNGITTPSGTAFVPMIKTSADVNAATLSEVKHESNYLLGFNEPDVSNEANMSVSEALGLWPQLEATGMVLGSPAVSWGTNSTTSWIGQFMQGARARGYRVNFITVHWYGQHNFADPATNVADLKSYLEDTYALYHLPIWVTEFSLIEFGSGKPTYATPAQEAAFLTDATKMLAELPYVQRYAWYTLTGTQNGGNTTLYNDGTATPTAVEHAFKDAP